MVPRSLSLIFLFPFSLLSLPVWAIELAPWSLPSATLGTNRTVRVWLPPGYDAEPRRRFPVVYLHDGQNVFSSAGTNCCFGWGSWEVDRAVERLAAAGRMQPVILVGVDNTRLRLPEYRGPTANPTNDAAFHAYRRFLVEELKPAVDARFRTRRGPEDTALIGSSLGGICSVAIAWEHPDVFGKAASLSGAFWIADRHFLTHTLQPAPRRKPLRLYLDSGVRSFRGGDDDSANTEAVAHILRRLGWRDGHDLLRVTDHGYTTEAQLAATGLRRDKWAEALTSQHNEFYWRERIGNALVFLFPAKR